MKCKDKCWQKLLVCKPLASGLRVLVACQIGSLKSGVRFWFAPGQRAKVVTGVSFDRSRVSWRGTVKRAGVSQGVSSPREVVLVSAGRVA